MVGLPLAVAAIVILDTGSRYFNRDVECIRTFFRRRFEYESALYPRFKSTLKEKENGVEGEDFRLDVVVAASGFKRRDMQMLEEVRLLVGSRACAYHAQYMDAVKAAEGEHDDDDSEHSEEEEELFSENESVSQGGSSRAASPLPGVREHVASLSLSGPHETDGNAEPSQQNLHAGDPALDEEPEASSSLEEEDEVKTKVANEIGKTRARQQKKYHSKKSTGRAGRAKGSKAKQDTRVHMDGGGW
jgi:RIO kinase 2